MLSKRIIPCLDIKDGRVVKGVNFVNLRDAGDPVEQARLYDAQGADELAPYMCLSDYVVSQTFGRGLVRYKTVAEGAEVCDFRYKQGRETFVYPLRNGWPPQFIKM